VPPGSSVVASVRKEVRGVVVCAPTHIVDDIARDASVLELKSNQRGEISMGLRARASDDGAAVRGTLQLASNFFADLECLDANVGTDRNDELGRIV
jgi:hypothetical protein